MRPPVDEKRRRADHTRPDPRPEIALDSRGDLAGTPIRLEPLEVEPEPARSFPQVWRVEVPLVGEERVVHLPERALQCGRLDRSREDPGPWVLRHHREVAEDELDRQVGQQVVGARAVRALVVAVLDDEDRAVAADVVVGPGLGRPGAP